MATLRGDGQTQSAQHEAGARTISNQVAALHLVVDLERVLTAELEQRRAAAEKLQSDYRDLTTRHEQVLAQAGLASPPPSVTLSVPGVNTSASDREVTVTFQDGLFDHGTHFQPGARDRLLAVAKALAGAGDAVQIAIIGYADDDRAFLKWTAQWESSLALDRASAVVGYFIALGLFEPYKLSGVAGDSQKRPFASDSIQSRLRSRIVVLRVSADR